MKYLFGWRTVLGLAIFTVFCVALFPYDRVRGPLCSELSKALGQKFQLTALDAEFAEMGFQLRGTGWSLGEAPQPTLLGKTFILRPELDVGWLRGSPSFRVRGDVVDGALAGSLRLGTDPGFRGTLEGFQLTGREVSALLPAAPELLAGATGWLDARFDLRGSTARDERWTGRIDFALAKGTLPVPEYPVSVPFETLSGIVDLRPRGDLELRDFNLQGPHLVAKGRGHLAAALAPERAPLNAELDLRLLQPALAGVVESLGVEVDAEGLAFVRLSGTLGRPTWR